MIQINTSATITLLLKDRNTQDPVSGVTSSNMPQILIRKTGGTVSNSFTIIDLAEIDNMPGVYEFTIPASFFDVQGTVHIYVPSFSVGTFTFSFQHFQIEVVRDKGLETFQGEVLSKLKRILGLNQENIRITDHVYDLNGNLIQSTIQTYNSKADLEDIAQNSTNHLAKYEMRASYDSTGNLSSYSVTKEI